jgi:flagellar hook-associated protein 3 FlgL
MRLSFLQGYNQSIQNIIRVQEQTFKTQEQISTNTRVATPSDDPVASAQLIQLAQEQSQLEQFSANADIAENRLQSEEVRINSVNDILVRIKELSISAANTATNDYTARQAIAAEMESRLDELVDLANAQDANGEYIFSGFQGDTKPFTENSDGSYTYNGDDGQRTIKIANGTEIALSDSGKAIFEDIESVNVRAVTSVGSSAGSITQATTTNQANYDAVYPNDYVIEITAAGYDLLDEDGNLITSGVLVGSTVDLDATLGIEFEINGAAVGDTFNIDSSGKQSVMTTIGLLAQGLNTLTDSAADLAELDTLIADSLTNIANAEESIGTQWSVIGARLNTVDSVRSLNEGVDLVNQEIISELKDLDMAEAISRLSAETYVLEAAQASFAKVTGLTLFNFL